MTRRPDGAPRLFAVPDPPDHPDGDPVAEQDEPATVDLIKHTRDPAVPDDSDVDEVEEVLEGRIIDRNAVATVRAVATHPHTKAAARHAGYIVYGVVEAASRIWRASSTTGYRQMMDAAWQTGSHETAMAWADRIEAARKQRHKRVMDLVELPARVLGALPMAAAALAGLLLVIGIALAVSRRDAWGLLSPWQTAAHLVALAVTIAELMWAPTLIAAVVVGLLVLWRLGRSRATLPGWLATSTDAQVDMPIDETTIARALEALRIPQITAYLKEGFPLQFIVPCRADGRGTHAVIRLPAGVTSEQIAKRRAPFAGGLYRRAQEVWITTGSEAGIMDVWAADKGALAEGAGPFPLLHEGVTDVFKGVPFGRTLRGDPLMAPIIGRNTIVGGMPDQGKSSAARILMLGCALDPTVELQIFVPDSNFDFEAFRPRCSVYVMGAEDEKIEQICLALEDVVVDIQVRGELLVRYEQEQVTRELASRGIGLHPKLVLLEEAHLGYGHPKFGARIAAADEMIVRLGRKRGIHKVTSTQATTGKTGIPPGVTINCSNGISFAVARWQENDALLGQGAYSAGHRATDLIPGEDRGNAVVKGFTGERSTVAQAYYVSPSKDSQGRDQVTPIIERSMAAIAKRGKGVPGAGAAPALPVRVRDLLDDLDEVLGAERVRLADLPALLRDLAPRWAPYRSLTGKQLEQRLAEAGTRITRTGNVPRLDPADLRAVIARRSTQDLDQDLDEE